MRRRRRQDSPGPVSSPAAAVPDDGGRVYLEPGELPSPDHGWWVVEVRGRRVGYRSSEAEALELLEGQRKVDAWWREQDPLIERPAGPDAPRAPMPPPGPSRAWRVPR